MGRLSLPSLSHQQCLRRKRRLPRDALSNCDDEDSIDDDFGLENDAENNEDFNDVIIDTI